MELEKQKERLKNARKYIEDLKVKRTKLMNLKFQLDDWKIRFERLQRTAKLNGLEIIQ
jgi:vacuolar-type H+-ATPase subunit D/Vma8